MSLLYFLTNYISETATCKHDFWCLSKQGKVYTLQINDKALFIYIKKICNKTKKYVIFISQYCKLMLIFSVVFVINLYHFWYLF